ncbi:MAG: hypothetical protein ACK53X_04365 [Holosporales bacterium]
MLTLKPPTTAALKLDAALSTLADRRDEERRTQPLIAHEDAWASIVKYRKDAYED